MSAAQEMPTSAMGSSPAIPLVTGPTATGKTEAAIAVARYLGAEIVSADSRQVYRGMNIGTAKPTQRQRSEVRHHLIDCVDPDQPFSAGTFRALAEECISEILSRGKKVIVVGGSTLYVEALVRGLADIPATDEAVRASLRSRLQSDGADHLYRELEVVDPVAAARMDASKTQRVLRALEVYHSTGKRISEYQKETRPPQRTYRMFIFRMDRALLDQRILKRARAMTEQGLVDEVRSLLHVGLPPTANAMRTIGYKEAMDVLEGRLDPSRLAEQIAANTRRYARRQFTWFKRYEEALWIDAEAAASAILSSLSDS
jgi:tRNA dimethylallyltransferase